MARANSGAITQMTTTQKSVRFTYTPVLFGVFVFLLWALPS